MHDPLVGQENANRLDGRTPRIAHELAPCEILENVALVFGLTQDEARALAEWLGTRVQKGIVVIDRQESSTVAWKK